MKNENRVGWLWPFFSGKEALGFAIFEGLGISVGGNGAGFSCSFGNFAIGVDVGVACIGGDEFSCNFSVVPPPALPAVPAAGMMIFALAFCGSSAAIFAIFACSGDLLRFFSGRGGIATLISCT